MSGRDTDPRDSYLKTDQVGLRPLTWSMETPKKVTLKILRDHYPWYRHRVVRTRGLSHRSFSYFVLVGPKPPVHFT